MIETSRPEQPKPTHAPPIWHSNHPPVFSYADLESNFWELYPRGEDLVLESVLPLLDATGLELRLRSERSDLSHYRVSINGSEEEMNQEGVIRVTFEDNHTLEENHPETRIVSIRVVGTDGKPSSAYQMRFSFSPKERYLSNGQKKNAHSRIQIQQSDIKMARSSVGDWILDEPTEEERAWAADKWGRLIQPDRSGYENARALGKSLLDDLNPHRGTPSDRMNEVKPFEQYERLVSGRDHCWCANLAEIFSYACNSLGIPARFIIMRHQLFPPPEDINAGFEVMLAGGHTTMEIFSPENGQWNWMDMSHNALGAYLGEEGPLSMLELHHFLNQPARLERLRVDFYDSEKKEVERVPVLESEKLPNFLNAFKQDQLFRYLRRPL